ncbi:MAG TPA: hypothetical protein VFO86_08945, partial [Terriglobia bacterium]|nr:hypothetical protein [Terriglobia bacterium]
RSLGFQLGLAGAALAVVAVLAFVFQLGRNGSFDRLLPVNQTAHQGESTPNSPGNDLKVDGEVPAQRAKTDAPDTNLPANKPGPEPAITDNSPAFLVTDPSGYSRNLEDYRGHVLLIGVWSGDRPEAAQNIQRLYESFGNRKEVRILCVTSRDQERPTGMTCPMVFNNGSRLLETKSSDFVIVDKEGSVQLRGSLAGDTNALSTKVRAKLDELGGK